MLIVGIVGGRRCQIGIISWIRIIVNWRSKLGLIIRMGSRVIRGIVIGNGWGGCVGGCGRCSNGIGMIAGGIRVRIMEMRLVVLVI